jgi:hypothetical protein
MLIVDAFGALQRPARGPGDLVIANGDDRVSCAAGRGEQF